MDTKPDHLIIKNSPWYGYTIFTTKTIKEDSIIAYFDKKHYDCIDGCVRTPYGPVFNSTDDMRDVNAKRIVEGNNIKIVAIRDINPMEEILCSY